MRIKRESIIALVFILTISFGLTFIVKESDIMLWHLKEEIISDHLKSYDISEQLSFARDNIESQVDKRVMELRYLLELNGMFQRVIDKRVIEDVNPDRTVYKLSNDQLSFNYSYYDVAYCVENLVELSQYLKKRDINLLYVQAPHKINKYNSLLPIGIKDTTNKNADNFLKGILESGIDIYDLREEIDNQHMNYNNLFYNTDHHWRIETAFWAYTNVLTFIESNYEIHFNPKMLDHNQFKQIRYENFFLGSLGRRVSSAYSGYDDFTVLLPKFETDYSVSTFKNSTNKVDSSGSFSQTIISQSKLESKVFDENRYEVYFGQDYSEVKVFNRKVSEKNILIIQDSFGLPFSAFMSLNFKHTDIIDLRHMKYESLFTYLDKKHYDLVLFLYNPSVFCEKDDESQFIFK